VRDVLAFAAVAAVIVVVPGPDMALVLRNGLAHGRRSALETALGINAGLLVWALASALGVAALLHASAAAFTVLKLAGAAYLVFLGVRALLEAWRGAGVGTDVPEDVRGREAFRQGLLTNVLNPKVAVVFTTLIPQFVDPTEPALRQTILLAAVFIAMGLAWLTAYALVVASVGAQLRRPVVRRALDAVVGTVLVALGVRLAVEPR
jgi:RhtB (resistance to homoserine/threonine) family protein